MTPNTRRTVLGALSLAIGGMFGCATPAVVFVSPDYNPQQIQRVALLGFDDFPGQTGSGAMVADVFEKYLLNAHYQLIEREQADQVLAQQNISLDSANGPTVLSAIGKSLGVDAVIMGSLSELTDTSEQTVMVDVPQEETEPVYQDVVVARRNGSEHVRSVQTGQQTTFTDESVPETETLPARVGLSARLVSVKNGELLWSGSGDGDGMDLSSAAEDVSSKIMDALTKDLSKLQKSLSAS